jgi:hypothetical protein
MSLMEKIPSISAPGTAAGNWKKYPLLFILFSILAYPLFYYAYKYGTPEFGFIDVFSYNKLYENWDFAHVDAPFNQRLISSFSIFLIHKSGISYSTETAVAGSSILPQVYFSALLFNFICVIGTCVVIYRLVEKHLQGTPLFSFLSGTLFLFGFGTMTFLLSALSDALAVFLLAVIFHYFLQRSRWQYFFLFVSIFQREYIFFVFGLLAAMYWWKEKELRRHYLTVWIACIAFFAVYFILRKTLFFTPRYDYQVTMGQMIKNILLSIEDIRAYLRQTLLIQNLLFLYFGVLLYKRYRKADVNRFHLLVILMLIAEIGAIGLLVRLGNNTGRCFYMVTPILIFYLASELKPLLSGKSAVVSAD